MTAEFKIHHLASEIVGTLRSSIKADITAQTFNECRTPYITAQVKVQILKNYSQILKSYCDVRL